MRPFIHKYKYVFICIHVQSQETGSDFRPVICLLGSKVSLLDSPHQIPARSRPAGCAPALRRLRARQPAAAPARPSPARPASALALHGHQASAGACSWLSAGAARGRAERRWPPPTPQPSFPHAPALLPPSSLPGADLPPRANNRLRWRVVSRAPAAAGRARAAAAASGGSCERRPGPASFQGEPRSGEQAFAGAPEGKGPPSPLVSARPVRLRTDF